MKRVGNLWDTMLSDENLYQAVYEVCKSHRWLKRHRPNRHVAKIELDINERVKELRQILEDGFVPAEPRVEVRYDHNAKKDRTISMPKLWPDQFVHHALIQVIQPVLMRGMDPWCCGSVPGRGASHLRKGIVKWVRHDKKGTKWCLSMDIHHFYDSIKQSVIMDRMKQLIKDRKVLDLIERITSQGVLIGVYTSQWFANTVLQPMDHMIRQSGLCSHYGRYMDNLTIFGPNKRKLRKLKAMIEQWLEEHDLKVKGDWQLFQVSKRMPVAVGYRYGRNHTLIKKHNLLHLKHSIRSYRRKNNKGKHVTYKEAAGLVSYIGQLRHCNNVNIYQQLYQGERVERGAKKVIRHARKDKEWLTWNTYLARMRKTRS